jgi:hypothetical protein
MCSGWEYLSLFYIQIHVHLWSRLRIYMSQFYRNINVQMCSSESTLTESTEQSRSGRANDCWRIFETPCSCETRKYKPWSSPLCSLPHSPVTSSLLVPDVFLSTLISNTLNLCAFLNTRDQVSYPYKTGNIPFLYILICIFWIYNLKTNDSVPNCGRNFLLQTTLT